MNEVINSNIQLWREKVLNGTITTEEMREALAQIRADRLGAGQRSSTSRERISTAKAKAAPVDSAALLAQLF